MATDYLRMLADADRIQAFQDAISSEVRPDDVVVELGCGLGTFSMMAARAGARRVIGVEADPVVNIARQIAERNGIKVDFIAADARDVHLPEPATVLIFEDFATGLLDGPAPGLLELARERWMADEYRVIPQGATLNVAPISSDSARAAAFPLEASEARYFGLDFQTIIDLVRNSTHHIKSPPDLTILAPPAVVLEHRFPNALPNSWATEAVFEFDREQVLDGVCLWHDLNFDAHTSYSNHPAAPAIYGQNFFAVPDRWTLLPGDLLRFGVEFQGAQDAGFWKWRFDLNRSAGESVGCFSGNTFASSPLTAQSLQDYRLDQVVRLTDRAKMEAVVLSLVDGKRTIKEICAEVQRQCEFHGQEEIVGLVLQHLEHRRDRSSDDSTLIR